MVKIVENRKKKFGTLFKLKSICNPKQNKILN